MSTPQAAKSSNPYPELPRIYNLRARPISAEEQVVFWDNPNRSDLVAYQLYACHTENRTGPKPQDQMFYLESQDAQWRPHQRYHGVVLHHGIDNPWDLCFFVRVVGLKRHGQFVGTHLAGRYRTTIPLSTLREHHRAPVIKFAVGEDRFNEDRAITIPQESWAGDMVWRETRGLEEVVHQHRGDSLIEREVQSGWEKVPAGLRKKSHVGRAWGNFTKHAIVPDTFEHIRNSDGSPCSFVRLEITCQLPGDL